MSRYSSQDKQTLYQDLIIAWWHPDYRDMQPIEAYREVRRQRHGDTHL